MNLPKDPIMLLSFVNTQLRDHYPSLQELCAACMVEERDICEKLAAVDYYYSEEQNRFM